MCSSTKFCCFTCVVVQVIYFYSSHLFVATGELLLKYNMNTEKSPNYKYIC